MLSVRVSNSQDWPDGETPPTLSRKWERCQFQCENGCQIYSQRPKPCAQYHCMWRLGFGYDKHARPDNLGVVFEGAPGGWLFAIETRLNAIGESLVIDYLCAMFENPCGDRLRGVCVRPFGGDLRSDYWIGEEPSREQLKSMLALVTQG